MLLQSQILTPPSPSPRAPQVLEDSPNEINLIKKSFGHLRRFAEFHMKVHTYSQEEADLRQRDALAARDELLEFAKIAEKVRGGSM